VIELKNFTHQSITILVQRLPAPGILFESLEHTPQILKAFDHGIPVFRECLECSLV
jgi:hypothetical protein